MYKFIRVLLLGAFAFLLASCTISPAPNESLRPIKATIVSPLLRLSDAGFVHSYKRFSVLQIYSSGVAIAQLKTGKNICINGACYTPSAFNEKFFKNAYYDGLLDDILNARQIFNGINLTKNECGFYQDVSKFSIRYLVCNDTVEFKDKTTKIIIKELR
ncbi:hypothetical protein [Campylobacter sp. 19-13652]|uniref:hypothetical protein n=1 Tax=Campylobacter sp. 19-13652 TaxID=2840180 RepID=UPI001C745C09|nr:hypothetical protein [Campylobacter sp. 19-13652]BCX78851.1 lipoprotein [Campylobacter sp. 19-13652]